MAVTVVPRSELVCRLHDSPVSAPAVAFVRDEFILGGWEPVCRDCLDFESPAKYEAVYLDDHHTLKSEHDPADNHDRDHRHTG